MLKFRKFIGSLFHSLLTQTLLRSHPQPLHHLMVLRIRRRLVTDHDSLPIQWCPFPLEAQILHTRYVLLPIPMIILEEDVDAGRIVPFGAVKRHFDDGVASWEGKCLSWWIV